ncbi:MAG: hypothetical protein MI784_08370 [Cytophagales bacterium]|nr:hypothetical protein [Cytophagales bacterium]
MDKKKLNETLIEIAELKNKLASTDYNDASYDDMEEELHDLEDEFMDEFGDILEDILSDIHEELCPDSEVLMPIAYLANQYTQISDDEFALPASEGVIVDAEAEEYDGKLVRLAIVPGPARIEISSSSKARKVIWKA